MSQSQNSKKCNGKKGFTLGFFGNVRARNFKCDMAAIAEC